MSKKAKIKKLQAANDKLAHEYRISEMARRMLIDDRRKFEHDLLMAKNEIDKLVDDLNARASYTAYLEAQVDELQAALGESQAGRAELQRQIDTDIWREQARGAFDHIDKLRAELDAVKKERDGWRMECGDINQYAARLESQIDELSTQLGAVREIVT